MGATSFERMRRTRAAEEMMAMIQGHDLEEFRLAFSLPCDPTEVGVQSALTARTDYMELRVRIEAWCDEQEKRRPVPEPEPEPLVETTEVHSDTLTVEPHPNGEAAPEPPPPAPLPPEARSRPKPRGRRKG